MWAFFIRLVGLFAAGQGMNTAQFCFRWLVPTLFADGTLFADHSGKESEQLVPDYLRYISNSDGGTGREHRGNQG